VLWFTERAHVLCSTIHLAEILISPGRPYIMGCNIDLNPKQRGSSRKRLIHSSVGKVQFENGKFQMILDGESYANSYSRNFRFLS
jgi:hypothetical protein